jgi:hypothetical protein
VTRYDDRRLTPRGDTHRQADRKQRGRLRGIMHHARSLPQGDARRWPAQIATGWDSESVFTALDG